jgi:hypothetical protein
MDVQRIDRTAVRVARELEVDSRPRSAVSRLTFQARRISSGGSRKTVASKQTRASLVCSGRSPSMMTN